MRSRPNGFRHVPGSRYSVAKTFSVRGFTASPENISVCPTKSPSGVPSSRDFRTSRTASTMCGVTSASGFIVPSSPAARIAAHSGRPPRSSRRRSRGSCYPCPRATVRGLRGIAVGAHEHRVLDACTPCCESSPLAVVMAARSVDGTTLSMKPRTKSRFAASDTFPPANAAMMSAESPAASAEATSAAPRSAVSGRSHPARIAARSAGVMSCVRRCTRTGMSMPATS